MAMGPGASRPAGPGLGWGALGHCVWLGGGRQGRAGPHCRGSWRLSHRKPHGQPRDLPKLGRAPLPCHYHPSWWVVPSSLGAPDRPPPQAHSGSKGSGVKGGSSASAGSAGPESLFSYGPLGCLRFSPFLGTWCATCLPKKKGGRRKNPRQTSYNPKRVFQVSTLAFSPKRGELMTAAPQTLLPASSPGATQFCEGQRRPPKDSAAGVRAQPGGGWISSRSAF